MLWRDLLAKRRYAGRIEIIVDVEKRRTETRYSNTGEITFNIVVISYAEWRTISSQINCIQFAN